MAEDLALALVHKAAMGEMEEHFPEEAEEGIQPAVMEEIRPQAVVGLEAVLQ